MTKPGWGAIVEGEPTDLDDWAFTLKEGFDPWVEIHADKTVLRSASFDQLTSANEVRDRALALIERVNGALAVSCRPNPARFGGVIQFAEDGTQHRTLFGEMKAVESRSKVRGFGVVIGRDGKPVPPPPPQPTEVQQWVEVAETDDLLNDALVFFGRPEDWFDIYKALECLCQRAGGEHAFLALNWEPQSEVKRLKRSADWFRHARRKNDRLENPMPLSEARALLGKLLGRALRETKP
jgi:hypothetical protein